MSDTYQNPIRLWDKAKHLIFTTSSDISDGIILSLDLKSGEIRIDLYQTEDVTGRRMDLTFGDLFGQSFDAGSDAMFLSRLEMNPRAFDKLVCNIMEFIETENVCVQDCTLAIEVSTRYYSSVVFGRDCDSRTLTYCEFTYLLVGWLSATHGRLYRKHLLEQELRLHSEWDDDGNEIPPRVFTVLRPDESGGYLLDSFITGDAALRKAQKLVDEICQEYPKGMLSEKARTFDADLGYWETPEGCNPIYLYQTDLLT